MVKEQEKSKIHPIARAIVSILWFSDLANKVLKTAKYYNYEKNYSPAILAICYFVFGILYKAPGALWLLGFLSFTPFVPVLEAMHFSNEKSLNKSPNNEHYKTGEIITIILGSILWLLVLLGSLSDI